MIGQFEGIIKDYGVSETKSGNPQVFIQFEVHTDGALKTLTWYGSFIGGAKDITLKTLIYCGLMPQHYGQLINLANGVASGMLNINKVLILDVQEEPKQDGSGMRTVVQWVNDPEMAPKVKKIDQAKNAQFFGSMRMDGDLIRLAGELGLPLNNGGMATMGSPANQQNMNPYNQQQAPQQQNYNQAYSQQQQPQQFNQQQQGQNGAFTAPF